MANPTLIHRCTCQRTNHDNFQAHGYREEGTTTTPFDMVVRNELYRSYLALDAIEHVGEHVPDLSDKTAQARGELEGRLNAHADYIIEHRRDMPEIRDWNWSAR